MTSLTPEYRRDPTTNRWVVIAPERAMRPLGLSGSKPHIRRDAERDICPFCAGKESMTTGEVYAIRSHESQRDGPGWTLRVVPNKFPAVRMMENVELHSRGLLHESFPGYGSHEVVIECAYHETNPTNLTDDEFCSVLMAYKARLAYYSRHHTFAYVMIFKNVGAEAGASLAHSHSQIVAMPVIPDVIRLELQTGSDYYSRENHCVFCDVIADTRLTQSRMIAETLNFVALSPFAARFAYETWILPKIHKSGYEDLKSAEALELAQLLQLVLRKIDGVLAFPAYNYYIHTAPLRANLLPYYHWHIEIIPRTARAAGFEWGSGTFINSTTPEIAASELRSVTLPDSESIVI